MATWQKRAQRMRVSAGTALGVVFLVFMHPSIRSLWIGGIIALFGALIRIWAAGHIEKGRELTRTGPYAFTRNPLYFGSFMMALGVLIAGQGYWLLPVFGLFFVLFYYPAMKAEEQELLNSHGQAFVEYSKAVPFFFPGRFSAAGSCSSSFLWERVIRNREHRTFAGLLVAEAFLVFRLIY
jgi:protein-S-isoprenylcysteine O-methyltransferase Ste14